MSSDTKWIIGTVIATGLAGVTAVLTVAGLLFAQINLVNTRIDDLARVVSELRTDVRGMDARLRAVEIAFAKVDQRLETLERAVIPAAERVDE